MNPEFFVISLLNGVSYGLLLFMLSSGLTLIFSMMGVLNFAHASFYMVGAYFGYTISEWIGFWPALVIAPLLVGACGALFERLTLRKVHPFGHVPELLVTFGLSVVIQNGLLSTFTADSQKLTAGSIEAASVDLGVVTLGVMPVLTFGSAVLVIFLLNQLFYRTALGRAFRATSDDATTAQLMGIRPQRVFAMATGIAMVVATIAALFLGTRANFDPSIGPARLLYAFEAVIIGGLGSLWGTLAGGIVIGLAQAIGASINPEWQILSGHIAFVLVLLIRPRGLFPRAND